MRKFIVSDLHGNGYVYDSIMNYLSNEIEYGNDDITLYINGDLIDRGEDSGSMLVDVLDKVENKDMFNIVYLGGNHELMMYQTYEQSKMLEGNQFLSEYSSQAGHRWIDRNMGFVTERYLKKHYTKEEISNMCEQVGNLDIYHKFDEKINDKQIMLMHACYILAMDQGKELKINGDYNAVNVAVWTRQSDLRNLGHVGGEKYFSIIGHSPVDSRYGYEFCEYSNAFKIDGGCAIVGYLTINYYARKKNMFQKLEDMKIHYSDYDEDFRKEIDNLSHVPLVEVLNDGLRILTFNYKNEIMYGNYYNGEYSNEMDNNELNKYRKNLNENQKMRKRIIK